VCACVCHFRRKFRKLWRLPITRRDEHHCGKKLSRT
jgi:hypothetical protein